MTLLWLFILLGLLGWAVAQAFVPAAIEWLQRYPDNSRSQPRRILLVCALPWLVPFTAIVAMAALAAAKSWGWAHDHCLFHAPHHPHFCFEHLPEMLLGHGHGHVVVTVAALLIFGLLALRQWRRRRRQFASILALTALSQGKGVLRVLDDPRVLAFAATAKRPYVYLSRGLLRELTRHERRMVIAHEAAHIRQRDLLFSQWVDRLLLLHLKPCADRLRLLWTGAIEVRADEQVGSRFGRVATAELLLRLARLMQSAPVPTAFSGGDVVGRIRILLYGVPLNRREIPVFEVVFTAGLLTWLGGLLASHHTLETLLGVLVQL